MGCARERSWTESLPGLQVPILLIRTVDVSDPLYSRTVHALVLFKELWGPILNAKNCRIGKLLRPGTLSQGFSDGLQISGVETQVSPP